MNQGTFEKETFIQSDAKTVINVISDYSNHHKIHPLIVNASKSSWKTSDSHIKVTVTFNTQENP